MVIAEGAMVIAVEAIVIAVEATVISAVAIVFICFHSSASIDPSRQVVHAFLAKLIRQLFP